MNKLIAIYLLILLLALSVFSAPEDVGTAPEIYKLSSIRTEGVQGIRFKAGVTYGQREEAKEYGFIVTTATMLESAELQSDDLVLDAPIRYSVGVAYNIEDGTDIIYEISPENYFFVGVMTGIPKDKSCYSERLVVRPFIKYENDNYVYGNTYERSVLDVAIAIRDSGFEGLTQEEKRVVCEILEICDVPTENVPILSVEADNFIDTGIAYPQNTTTTTLLSVDDPLGQKNKVLYFESAVSDRPSWTYFRTVDINLIPGTRYCLEFDILPGTSAVGTVLNTLNAGICFEFADNTSSKVTDHGLGPVKVNKDVWSTVTYVYTLPEGADANRKTALGLFGGPVSISGYTYKVPINFYLDNIRLSVYNGSAEDGIVSVVEGERVMNITYDYLNITEINGESYDTSEIYGLYKNESSDNYYSYLAKILNSERFTERTAASMKDISDKDVQYCHMGQLIIHEGICYASYLQNTGTDGDNHSSSTSGVVLAIFPLDKAMSNDFSAVDDIEFYPVGSLGDSCAGMTATSIYKDNSMCLVGNKMYVCFSFTAEDGLSYIFSKAFDIKTKEWVEENQVKLRYKGKLYDFTDESINVVYKDKGLPERANGLIELVSQWSEYNGEYYATGITIGGPNHGFVVKTKDFKTMDVVDAIHFNDYGESEVSSYIFKGKLFVACRQQNGKPYLYLGSLDLDTLTWGHYFKVPDGNSRPWFFEQNGTLYLLHTTEEIYRRYTNISRIRFSDSTYNMMGDIHPVETVATIKNCGSYFATYTYNNNVYFVCTQNTEKFGKLCLDFYNEDEVNKILLDLFG